MYIEREAAIDFVNQNTPHFDGETTMQCVERALNEVPAVDVAPIKHGKWIGVTDFGNGNCIGYCSACGTTQKAEHPTALKMFHKYCRWCGAKMDGKEEKNG